MRTFDIFSNGNGKHTAVKQGWSWPAFFFSWLWSLFSGLWIAAFLTFPVEIILNVVANVLNRETYDRADLVGTAIAITIIAIFLGIRLLFGARGNVWRRARLERKGYSHFQSVQAESPKAAIESILNAQP